MQEEMLRLKADERKKAREEMKKAIEVKQEMKRLKAAERQKAREEQEERLRLKAAERKRAIEVQEEMLRLKADEREKAREERKKAIEVEQEMKRLKAAERKRLKDMTRAPGQYNHADMVYTIDTGKGNCVDGTLLRMEHISLRPGSLTTLDCSRDGISANNLLSLFDRHLSEPEKALLLERTLQLGYLSCLFMKTRTGQEDEFRVILQWGVIYDDLIRNAVKNANIRIRSSILAALTKKVSASLWLR